MVFDNVRTLNNCYKLRQERMTKDIYTAINEWAS